MLIFKLAFRNLLGAGKRTWLNAIVLSLSFVVIIFYNGMMDGWNQQARRDMIAWDIGQGQLWHSEYDPYDPFTLQDAHAEIPGGLAITPAALPDKSKVEHGTENQIVPILITQATAYPKGRSMPTLLKGIPANQSVLELPTAHLGNIEEGVLPAIIGRRMARRLKVEQGDRLQVTYRDKNGTFDATEIRIDTVFKCDVPNADAGQIWIDLNALQEMKGMEGEATVIVSGDPAPMVESDTWTYKTLGDMTAEMDAIIASKKGSSGIIYGLLLIIALLAIFDTQVLSIFRRQKEIGTFMALGMTRWQVVGLFTVEGGASSIFAMLVGSLYGVPLFVYLANKGIQMPAYSDNYGMALAETIFPVYGISLIVGTVLFIAAAATLVSFLPARKIAKMNPTAALKGKLQ